MNLTRKTNEIKLAEIISSGSSIETDSPHIVTAYTATLSEDDFELDIDQNVIKPKSETFLKNIQERCDLSDKAQMERYNQVKSQVLDRARRLLTSSPSRRLSVSSTTSLKRDWCDSDEDTSEKISNTKPRVTSPRKSEL